MSRLETIVCSVVWYTLVIAIMLWPVYLQWRTNQFITSHYERLNAINRQADEHRWRCFNVGTGAEEPCR